jgi:hypothetical protein
MRIDLETIKKIEFFLTNNMTSIEKKMFEQEIANSTELKVAVDQQKNLMKAMEKSYMKSQAISAGRKYRRSRMLKRGAVICTVLVLLVGTFAGYTYLKDQPTNDTHQITGSDYREEPIVPQTSQAVLKDTLIAGITTIIDSAQAPITEDVQTVEKKGTRQKKDRTILAKTISYQNDSTKTEAKEVIRDQVTLDIKNQGDSIQKTQMDSVEKTQLGKTENEKIFKHFEKKALAIHASANKDIYIAGDERTMIRIPARSLIDK